MRRAVAPQIKRGAVPRQRVEQVVDPADRRYRGDSQHRRVLRPERTQRGVEVPDRAKRRRAEIGLGDNEDVRHLHDPRLEELQDVAGARLHDHDNRVRDIGDLGLGLADADGLDHDHVERDR